MNEAFSPPNSRSAAETLFAFYELWLAERMPDQNRDAVYWRNEKIDYGELRDDLLPQRKYYLDPAPYPGLRSFRPQESQLFFGRRSDVDEVRERLKANRIVMVVGGSGSGKSSLIRAGLLPHLNGPGRIPGRGGTWYWAEFRPGTTPIKNLTEALTKDVVQPLLKAIKDRSDLEPEFAAGEIMSGLSAAASFDEAEAWVAAPFARATTSDERFDALWDFVETRLDRLNEVATGGIGSGQPNLLILLDQFEEVFREPSNDEQQKETLELLRLIARLDERLCSQPWSDGGLFLAMTMRSEEFHRCSEYDRLTDIVNRSMFMLELLDPERESDRKVLLRAVREPARRVFVNYDLVPRDQLGRSAFDPNDPDSPFAPGVPDWLINGSLRQKTGLEHRPDQLPLLQHALRAMWDRAIVRWKDEKPEILRIEKKDLPGDDPKTDFPDLDLCLSDRANAAAKEARWMFRSYQSTGVPQRLSAESYPLGEEALRAAFSALARLDDRGNRARRFATIADMIPFLDNSIDTMGIDHKEERLRRCLSALVFRGYLNGGGEQPYDISHEALIRNWKRCDRWLGENEEIVRALRRFLDEVKPEEVEALESPKDNELIADSVPAATRSLVGDIGANKRMPDNWAVNQIGLLLRSSSDRRRTWTGHEGQTSRLEAVGILARMKHIAARAGKARDMIRETAARRNERLKVIIAGASIACALAFLGVAYAYSQYGLAHNSWSMIKVETPEGSKYPHPVKLAILEMTEPRRMLGFLPSSSAERVSQVTWDRLSRNLIGSNFWLDTKDTAPSDLASCWVRVGQSWQQNGPNGEFAVFNPMRGVLSVKLQPSQDALNFALALDPTISGRSAAAVKVPQGTNGPLPPLGDGAEICISRDFSVLTASIRNSPVPSINEVYFLKDPSNQWQVWLRPIVASLTTYSLDSKPRQDGALATPKAPELGNAQVKSIDIGADGAVRVGFNLQGGTPETTTTVGSFVAAFYKGWAAAQRTTPPTQRFKLTCKDMPEEQEVDDQDKTKWKKRWVCPLGGSAFSTIRLMEPPKAIDKEHQTFIEMSVELKNTHSVPIRLGALVPPTVEPFAFAKDDSQSGEEEQRPHWLIVKDANDDFWAVNLNEDQLKDKVRTFGDINNVPPGTKFDNVLEFIGLRSLSKVLGLQDHEAK
jgi:energy-coupling factor transporter ATP-binding protein EcfA2